MYGDIDELIDDIRSCKKGCYPNSNNNEPMVEGSSNSKILLISQAPSEEAWGGSLFTKSNPTADQLAELFKIDWGVFNSENFFWIHYCNCFPGKRNGGDIYPGKEKCANEYLKRTIKTLNPKLIVLMGGLAIKYFYPGMELGDLVGVENIPPIKNQYKTFCVHHISSANNRWIYSHKENISMVKSLIPKLIEVALNS